MKTKCSHLLLVLGMLLLVACRSVKGADPAESPTLAAGEQVAASPPVLTRRADPPRLRQFAIKTVEFQGQTWPAISFDPAPGLEFIEWQACPMSRPSAPCKEGSIESTSHVLTNLPVGVLTIKVRPCRWELLQASLERACGDWQERPYAQARPVRERLSELLEVRTAKAQAIRNLGVLIFDALESYKEGVAVCHDDELKAIIPAKTYNTLLGWGPGRIGLGLLDPDASLTVQSDERIEITSELGGLEGPVRVRSTDLDGKDGDEAVAKLSFVAGALAIVAPVGLKLGAKLLAKPSKAKAAQFFAQPGPNASPQEVRFATASRTIMIGLGITTLMGLVVYAALNKESALKDAAQEYIKDVFSLSGSSCASMRTAADAVVAANTQAASLRNELATIQLEIDIEVERGKKLSQP